MALEQWPTGPSSPLLKEHSAFVGSEKVPGRARSPSLAPWLDFRKQTQGSECASSEKPRMWLVESPDFSNTRVCAQRRMALLMVCLSKSAGDYL